MEADIIIAGGGTAGSVLASRLSADPRLRVLLIEAGPNDSHPFIRIPKGMAKLLSNPRYTYYYPTQVDGTNLKPEVMLRGKTLGGSSAVNGMVYHRGQPADYDSWVALGLPGWGWADMQRCFVQIEDHVLPETPWRGRGGPIPIRVPTKLPPLAQAIVGAAKAHGLPYKDDPNLLEQVGAGPIAETIGRDGQRVSASRGFLTPEVRRRPNLTILTETVVERILFDGKRARGVRVVKGTERSEHLAAREVILCTGTIETPRLLQISGVGSATLLNRLGVDVVHESQGVGANYRDHYAHFSQWRLRHHRDSENRFYHGLGQARSIAQYLLTRGGPLGYGSHRLSMFADVASGTGRADAEFLFAPYSLAVRPGQEKIAMEEEPGGHFYTFPLRGTSEGTIEAASTDIRETPIVRPHYLATEHDRRVMIGAVRKMRAIMTDPSLAGHVVGEIGDAAEAQTDDEIIHAALTFGSSSYHSIGTCRMGVDGDPMAVLDPELRVRGLRGLRVVDCSVMPEQLSANTMGPILAIAWRASEMIQADLAKPAA